MNSTDQAHTDFFALETVLHKKNVRNSPDAVAALLADDFMEFGSSGRTYSKTTIIELMQAQTIDSRVTVEDFQSRELGAGVVLVTYVSIKPVGQRRDDSCFALLDLEASSRWVADGIPSGNHHGRLRSSRPALFSVVNIRCWEWEK